MFENCSTLLDLNKARIEAVREDRSKLEIINREYQDRRKQLVAATPKYVQLKPMRPQVENRQPIMGIPYAGASEKELTLTYTKRGFTC